METEEEVNAAVQVTERKNSVVSDLLQIDLPIPALPSSGHRIPPTVTAALAGSTSHGDVVAKWPPAA